MLQKVQFSGYTDFHARQRNHDPITASLMGKFTTRKLFITAMSIFAFGTFIATISPNFSVLLLGRVFQGAGAGIMMPLLQTIMFLLFPIEQRGKAMGLYGLVIAFGQAIGRPYRDILWITLHGKASFMLSYRLRSLLSSRPSFC